MPAQLLRWIALGAIVLAGVLVLVAQRLKQNQQNFVVARESSRVNQYSQWLYYRLIRLPLIGKYALSIRERIILTDDYDEGDIINNTVAAFVLASVTMIGLLIFFSLFIKTWYIWFVLLILMYFIFETVVDIYVYRLKNHLLEQLVQFIDYLRNAYFETHMIDEAYLIAIDKMTDKRYRMIKAQALQIYDTLTDADGELALQTYYQRAPNPFLKLLAGLSYIVKEYGDDQLDSGSAYIKSLSHLSSEVKDEIIKRTKLAFGLKSMNFIALAPILAMHPIKNWASTSFYPLKQFYSGYLGFIVEIGLLIIVLISYYLLRNLQKVSDEYTPSNRDFKLEKLVSTYARPLLRALMPSSETRIYQRVKQRLLKAHSFIRIDYHYAYKLLAAFVAFCLTLGVIVIALNIQRDTIWQSPTTPSGFLAGELKGDALDEAVALTQFDNQILSNGLDWTVKRLANYLEENYDYGGELKRLTIDRLLAKQTVLRGAVIRPIHLFILYIATLIGWWLPELYLIIRHRLLKADVEIEISRFQLVVMILMHIETMTVDAMLEWFEKFSVLFKIPIQQALMNYDAGAGDALETLKHASDRNDYQTLINHLISCTESLTITEAFSEFETEKLYYQDKRRMVNDRIVGKRIFLGQVVGFIPVYALLILYFMFPLIYASIGELQTYFDKLSF